MADFRTTPISLQTFMSITDSNGLFKTWADIVKNNLDNLPVNEDIMGAKLTKPVEIQGNNIVFENVENKNVLPFIDDLTKRNNTLTLNKMIMNLYSDYMLPLEFNILDKHSAIEWSQILSDAMSSMQIARKDLENMEVIDEIQKVCIALGRVSLIEGANESSTDFEANKRLGVLLSQDRIQNRTNRTKFSKGFQKSLERCIVSPTLSINLLSGMTSTNASNDAYIDMQKRFQANNVWGHNYESAPMYLGKNIGMSEFIDDKKQKQNTGANTGQLIKPYYFADLAAILFYNDSIAFYEQNFELRTIPSPYKRYTDVMTIAFRMNAAIKPVYAGMNKCYFSKIPKWESYIDLSGNTIPEMDLSKAADFNKLVNALYNSQPSLYSMFGWNGASNIQQGEVDKIWQQKINWKAPAVKSK